MGKKKTKTTLPVDDPQASVHERLLDGEDPVAIAFLLVVRRVALTWSAVTLG